MPEGPEIRRAADKIAQAIAHRPVQEIFFAFEHLKGYERIFQGQTIVAVEPYGKALLTQFEDGQSIYSHNQLYGKWMIRKAYSYPSTNRQLRLAIHNDKKSALLYSASDIEVLAPEEIAAHPFLSKLGPDVVNPNTPLQRVVDQVKDKTYRRRRFAGLLLNQQFLSGLGNYLRSEILFVARIHPNKRPMDCTDSELSALGEAAVTVSRQSYETGGITNDPALATQLKQAGWKRWQYRHWVFSRAQQPCHICTTPILKETLAGRRLYYCPQCQPE